MNESEYINILVHLISALVAGAAIGLERSFHGRPAGFRTHTLVCLTSSLLMLVTLYQSQWMPGITHDMIRIDPTRTAQGIMTGIGFLGAGVIFKEGLSVRGLTTAASIWITAAIGILMGIGFFFPAIIATVLTVGILSVFRRIESLMPSQIYAHHWIRFARHQVLDETELRTMLKNYGFSVNAMSYHADQDDSFRYQMTVSTLKAENLNLLSHALLKMENVEGFGLSPTGD
ncbi:MgtC/SapB family protein [Alkanindiges illinoisensis]|uniref:Protein MgtC n=1 Tax=Alkanindiges illinoisensis TaxID=197183 RepID=A0A4Y7XF90_9GAMM|nr:MgtC/SapB family protein [Alkanindiges illinoisensis]TEU30502.1 MgtC/SapB family protein [Alkanindiges illinoisensis]